jgi:transcriptional antiterminator RfaH
MQQWIVLFTQPHKEFQVQGLLRGRSIETYLPTTLPARPRSDRRAQIPFFPRYLFAHVDLSIVQRSSLEWMPGVTSIVSFDGQPAIVSHEAIELIRARLARLNERGFSPFERGERVRITSGPLRHMEAVFDRALTPAGRVRILLDAVRRMMPVEIDMGALERAQPARRAA